MNTVIVTEAVEQHYILIHCSSSTHIGNNRQNGHCVEDFLPCADVSGLGCHRSSELGGELPGVHPDLQDVVEQSQQGSQGEGRHKQSDETKLDH